MVHGKNFAIEYNGNVIPCTHFAGFPLFNIFKNGSILNAREFIAEYNGEMAIELRRRMGFYPSKKCDSGLCSEPCSGGCPLLWKGYDPEMEIPGVKNA